jgi:ribosome production factor 2
MNTVLKDLYTLKKPAAKQFTKRNLTRPFEDPSSVEFLCRANDSSLFSYVSHSKKRPQNLVMGRLFDFQILDMIELSVDPLTFKSMADFEGTRQAVVRIDSKPMFIFQGSEFESDPDLKTLKNLFLDYFRGQVLDKINIAGLDRVVVCTAHKSVVYFRHYGILLKTAGTKYPRVELDLVGPSMDLKIRRVRSGQADIRKLAMHTPRTRPNSAKRHNKEAGQFGSVQGRIHIGRQNLDDINLAKHKGLKKRKVKKSADASTAVADQAPQTDPAVMTDV